MMTYWKRQLLYFWLPFFVSFTVVFVLLKVLT